MIYFILFSLFFLAVSVVLDFAGKRNKTANTISNVFLLISEGIINIGLLFIFIKLIMSSNIPWHVYFLFVLIFIIVIILFITSIKNFIETLRKKK